MKKVLLLLLLIVCSVSALAQGGNSKVENAQKTLSKVDENSSYVDDLLKATSYRATLPVGIKRTISNNEIVITIDKAQFLNNSQRKLYSPSGF